MLKIKNKVNPIIPQSAKVSKIPDNMRGIITWISRLLIGGIFVYSGFVKAVDPWGTFYKMQDYMAAFGLDISSSMLLAGVFVLFSAEFLIGVCLITGAFRRLAVWSASAFMAVMLPLTLWIAIKDPVADCGCFGDAWVISNWGTFFKNIAITAVLVWLWLNNRKSHWLVTPALQWIEFVASTAYIVAIGWFAYAIQPPIDFRPYKVGTSLFSESNHSEAEPEYVFIYEKDGMQKEFGIHDELPDEEDGWTFVDRKEIGNEDKSHEKADGLTVYDSEDSSIDSTEDISGEDGPQLLLLVPDVKSVSASTTWKINELYDLTQSIGIPMAGIVYGSSKEISDWVDLSMAEYPVYTSDDTLLKEIARGNPAVVYVDGGKIIWKMTLRALDIDKLIQDKSLSNATDKYNISSNPLLYLTVAYIAILAAIILASFMPPAYKIALRGKRGRKQSETGSSLSQTKEDEENRKF